jgi:hypothetical protein
VQFLQASSDKKLLENSSETTKFRNVYTVPENWDMTPAQGELQRLDTEITTSYVLKAMESIFRPESWRSFGSNYPADIDDFLTKPYPRFVKEKFGIEDDIVFNSCS